MAKHTMPDPSQSWARLPLVGTHNTRDLGGLPASDGRMVARGRFLRSDSISNLTPADEDFLYDYGVRTILDLRDEHEVKRSPDKLVGRPGVTYRNIPLLSGNAADVGYVREALPNGVTMADIYLFIIENRQPVGEVFHAIADASEGCILFHCAVGKDRTGIVGMLLLRLAGVDEFDCVADYVQTQPNMERDPGYRELYAAVDPSERQFMESRAETIRTAMSHIREKYGNERSYLRACGVTDDELDSITRRLLGEDGARR